MGYAGGRSLQVELIAFAIALWGTAASAQIPQQPGPLSVTRMATGTSMRAPLPRGLTIQTIAPVSMGIWFVTTDTRQPRPHPAVQFWSGDGLQSVFPDGNVPDDILVSSLTTDPSGHAWLVTDGGVYQWEGGAFRHRQELDSLHPKALAGGKDLWIVTGTNELMFAPAWQADRAWKKTVPAEGPIVASTITSLGDLRFVVRAADGDRLFEASPTGDAATEIPSLAEQVRPGVAVLYSDSDLNLWIGLQNGTLLRCGAGLCDTYAPGTFGTSRIFSVGEDAARSIYLLLAGNPGEEVRIASLLRGATAFQVFSLDDVKGLATAIGFDEAGGVWLGTTSAGALRLEDKAALPWQRGGPAAVKSTAAAKPLSAGGPVARAGVVTQATGITNYQNAKFAHLFSTRGLSSDHVSSIAADNRGNLYFTTGYTNLVGVSVAGGGLSRWDHRQFKTFTTANGLASNTVQSSFFDTATGLLWIGTDTGLSRLNPANDTFLANLLPGVNIRDIKRDGSGNIWVGSWGSGVYRLNPATGATLNQFTSPSGPVHNNVSGLAFEDNGNVLWVATDRGNPVSGTEQLGGISRYQINTNQWTSVNLNSLGGVVQYDSNRVLSIAVDASNNVWISSFTKGVYRIAAGNALTAAAYTRFQQSNGLGGNASNVVYQIYRDLGNNLWFSFGGFGDVANPQKAAATFLAAAQINSAAPAFTNYNSATNAYPSNVIGPIFAEDASTMWFGTQGAGVFRLGGPGDAPGWPKTLAGYVYTSSPVLADLEGTGKLNIVVGDQAGLIYAYRYDGTLVWGYDAHNAFPSNLFGAISIQSSPSVGDVDGDGLPEVVVGVGGYAASNIGPQLNPLPKGAGALLVLSNTGQLKRVLYPYDISDYTIPFSKQDGLPDPIFATPTLANADDDPELEIHFGAWDNFFYSINSDGSPIYTLDNDGDGQFDEDFMGDFSPFTPADPTDDGPGFKGIDDNHNGEIDEGDIYDDDEDGLQDEDWPEFPFWAGDSVTSSAVVVDLFGTGQPNIIFGQDYAGPTGSPYSRGGILRVIDRKGSELAGFPKGSLEQVIQSTPAVVDLDGDGTLEIVHGSGLDRSTVGPTAADLALGQLLYAWKRDGSSFKAGAAGKFASTIVPGVAGSGGLSFSSIAIGDLDRDGQPELVLVTTPLVDKQQNPIDASGNPTTVANTVGQMVYAFKRDGSLMAGFPVRPFMFMPNPPILGSPAIADVNGDGFPDIIVPAGFGLIVIDRNGRVLPGMGDFENLQDPVSAVFQESSPAVGDIDGDGQLEIVWASGTSNDGGTTGTGGILRVVKVGPVNAGAYEWPMFQRDAERNPVYDVFVSQPAARVSGSQVIVSARVLHGARAIGSAAADLSSFGGLSSQPLYDDGTHGDAVANDGLYTFAFTSTPAPGRYYFPVTATDVASRTARATGTFVQRGAGKILVSNLNAIDFGAVGRGLNEDRHLNLINVGNTTVTISSVTSSNPEFFVDSARSALSDRAYVSPKTFPQSIPAGGVLNLLLRAHPAFTSSGVRTSTLTINSDGGNKSVNLSFSTLVINGGIQVADSSNNPTTTLAYPTVAVNSTVQNLLLITSKGPDPLIITNITIDNPAYTVYQPNNPTFPRTYPVNTTAGSQFFGNHYRNPAALRVKFTPTSAGYINGTMKLFTNDPANPVVSIALTGGGASCSVSLDQTNVNVPADPGTVIFTVTAPSTCPWTVQSNVPWANFIVSAIREVRNTLTLSGTRALAIDIRRNTSSVAQSGTIVANGVVLTIHQAGSTDTSNLRFVYAMFNNFLAREPGQAGVDFFLPLLNSGALGRSQMAYNMFSAAEFNIIERYVIGLYYGILGRDPDYYGWDFHRRNMHLGVVQQDTLARDFLNSAEYALRYGNPTNAGFVQLLYQNALGRTPSAPDLAYWQGLLDNNTATRVQVAQAILNSPEFQQGHSTRQTVFLMHATMLSRAPGDVGYQVWMDNLNAGVSLFDAVNAFILSPEFQIKLGPN